MIRAIIITSILFLVLSGCLFGGAGTISWPMAWVVLGIYLAFKIAAFIYVDPELIKERAAPGEGSGWIDILLATLGFLALYPATYVIAGLDTIRYGNSHSFTLIVQIIALLIHFLGYCFAFWAVLVNPFFSTVVRIQDDRGQMLISSGPYAIIRHPGYSGVFLAHLALPLIFESMWAFLPTIIGVFFFILRTAREDRMLELYLADYSEYQTQVRWRLLPGIW